MFVVTLENAQESKESYHREQQMKEARDAQFIDDFKRAILLDGGYITGLGPEVCVQCAWARDGLVAICVCVHGLAIPRTGGGLCSLRSIPLPRQRPVANDPLCPVRPCSSQLVCQPVDEQVEILVDDPNGLKLIEKQRRLHRGEEIGGSSRLVAMKVGVFLCSTPA
jgi:hypothetical protein